MSRFFLDRPVFAWVIAIAMMLGGALAIYNLPVSQYPPIAPPSISISAFYTGASAETTEDSRRPDHRAEDDRARPHDLHGLDRRLVGHGHGHAHVRAGHRPRPGLGQGAEQAAAGAARAAGHRPAPGRDRQQVHPQLPDDRRPDHGRRQPGDGGPERLHRVEDRARAGPRAGRGRGAGLRHRLLDAGLVRPRQAGQVPHDVGRRGRGGAGLQRRGVRRPARRRAGRPRPAAQRLDPGPVAAQDPRGVRGHPAAHEPRRLRGAHQGRRAHGAGHRPARHPRPLQPGPALRRPRHPPGGRRQRARHRRRGQGQAGRALEPAFPRRDEGHLPLRHDALRARGHRRGGADADRGHRAGLLRHVPVPGQPARHARADHRGAGGDPGDLRRAGPAGLLDQHADHVRDGAGHRPAGRRRHRGGRERRARDERGGPAAARGHPQVDAGDPERPGRHRPGAGGRVRPDDLLPGLHRRHLPAVLGHGHRLDAALGAGGVDPLAGALRRAAQAGRQGARGRRDRLPPAAALPAVVRPRLLPRPRRLPGLGGAHPGPAAPLPGGLRRHRRADGGALPAHADRLPARRGPGRRAHDGAAPGRLHARADHAAVMDKVQAHFLDGPEGGRRGEPGAGRRRLRRPRPEPGHGLREAPRLGPAPAAGAAREGRGRPGHAGLRRHPRGDHHPVPAARRPRARHRPPAST